MMQHNKFDGTAIGEAKGERFEDRMRRIRRESLVAAKLRAKDDSPWFALRVMSGREKTVQQSLDDEKIEAIVPMRKGPEIRRRHRVLPPQMLPVMSSYVLVRCMPSDEAFVGFLGVEHVNGMLGGCLNPHTIAAEEVNRFKAMADEGQYDWEKPVTSFKMGAIVRVTEGPFAGFCGKIVTCRSDGRGDAVVEMTMFSGVTPALIPLAILEKT
jgi:transcriptional antiterminator NusG